MFKKLFDNINEEFWLGQIFMILATVIGVYMAANSGFEKALQFESLQAKRAAYFTQQAVYNELVSNTQKIAKWVDQFEADPQRNNMDLTPERYQLNFFLWESMQEGQAVFEIPYQYFAEISLFYEQSNQYLKVLVSGNPFEAPKAAKKLKAQLEGLKTGVQDDFKFYIEKEKASLLDAGVLLKE